MATGVLWSVRVSGRENVPGSGPYLLAPVHRSNIDTFLVARLTKRRLRYMGKDSLWKYPALGRLFTALGAFPVHREGADRDALRTSVQAIEAGEPLVLFPEGSRRSGPKVAGIFEGAAYVALRTAAPIVPVGIAGSESALGKGLRLPRPGPIEVVVGEPIVPEVAAGAGMPAGGRGHAPRRVVTATTARLAERMQVAQDVAGERLAARSRAAGRGK